MDLARLEALCLLYVGSLFSACGGLLAWSTGDTTWLIIFSTGPVFVVIALYWLYNPNVRSTTPTEFGLRQYTILALAAIATVVVAGLLVLEFT